MWPDGSELGPNDFSAFAFCPMVPPEPDIGVLRGPPGTRVQIQAIMHTSHIFF